MATFSIGEAAKSGFRIIRDHPTAVLMWSLAYYVIVFLPQMGLLAMAWGSLTGLVAAAGQTTGDKPSADTLQAARQVQAHMSLIQAVQFAGSLLWSALFFGAVYRAVLEPEGMARWFMRLGKQELWVGVVLAVAYVLFIIAIVAGMMPLILYGAMASVLGRLGSVDWIGMALLGFAIGAAICWAAIRLSLAFPMSFADRNFRLFESWALTRGHALRIFLAMLLVMAVVLLLEVLLFGGVAIALLGVAVAVFAKQDLTADGAEAAMQALVQHPPENWPVLVIVGGLGLAFVLSTIGTALTTILVAPCASIYRQLTAVDNAFA